MESAEGPIGMFHSGAIQLAAWQLASIARPGHKTGETHGCGGNINSAIQFCQNGIWINPIYSQVRPCANLAPVHLGIEN